MPPNTRLDSVPEPLKPEQIADLLRSRLMVLHESFAGDPEFLSFCHSIEPALEAYPILVPSDVRQRLAVAAKADGYAGHLAKVSVETLRSQPAHFAHQSETFEKLVTQIRPVLVLVSDEAVAFELGKLKVKSVDDVLAARLDAETGRLSLIPLWLVPPGPGAWFGLARRRHSLDPFPASDPARRSVRHPSPPSTDDPRANSLSWLRLEDGRTVRLGDKVGGGGEGVIYLVDSQAGEDVVKIYHGGRIDADRRTKLELMMTRRIPDRRVCWPQGFVYDARTWSREPVGVLMPRAGGTTLEVGLHDVDAFLRARPRWTRRHSAELAVGLLGCIARIHRLNVVLGDINPANFLVDSERSFFLVDCDSFQVGPYPSLVGRPEYTAPEIGSGNYGASLRTRDHDLFSVATLLFTILIPGRLPYDRAGALGTYQEKLQAGVFPYSTDLRRCEEVPTGPWKRCWANLSPALRAAFVRAFDKDSRMSNRVPVLEWVKLLQDYRTLLFDQDNVYKTPIRGYDLNILPREVEPPYRA
jgi:hypothetical protein